MELSNRELRRFENQIKLPGIGLEGQIKLKNSKVAIVGAGGIGTNVLMHLVTSGIGTLGIIDNSIIEESNLHRQVLYGSSDLGKQKAIVAKQKLQEINPQTIINIHNLLISASNAYSVCDIYDLVIDTTNSAETFENIFSFCYSGNKPLIFARIKEFIIEIAVITNFKEFQQPDYKNNTDKNGFVSSVSGIAGSMISLEAIKLISGLKSSINNRLLKFNALDLSII